ncbi:MAG: hypothetical protein AAB573_04255 [Patescibacteria group bacterium]
MKERRSAADLVWIGRGTHARFDASRLYRAQAHGEQWEINAEAGVHPHTPNQLRRAIRKEIFTDPAYKGLSRPLKEQMARSRVIDKQNEARDGGTSLPLLALMSTGT